MGGRWRYGRKKELKDFVFMVVYEQSVVSIMK